MNTNGLERNFQYINEIGKYCDILFLQETWIADLSNNDYLNNIPSNFQAFSMKRTRKEGQKGRMEGTTAWLIHKNYVNKIKIKHYSSRISEATLTLNQSTYFIIGAYMNSNGNNVEYVANLNMIKSLINKRIGKGMHKIMLVGDLNADITRHNENDISLREWLDENHLTALNRLFTQRACNTYLGWRKNFSNIDYICIRREWDAVREKWRAEWPEVDRTNIVLSSKEIDRMTACDTDDVNRSHALWQAQCEDNWECTNCSDHRPLSISMEISTSSSKAKSIIKFKRLNWLNNAHVERYNIVFEKNLSKSDLARRLELIRFGHDNELKVIALEKWANDLAKILVTSKEGVEKELGVKRPYTKSNEWWTDEMERLKWRRWVAFILYRTYRTEEFRLSLAKTRHEFKNQMRFEKKRVENIKAQRLNLKFRQNRIIYWQTIKKMRQNDIKPQIELSTLTSHFSKVLNETNALPENAEYDERCRLEVNEERDRICQNRGTHIVEASTVKAIIRKLKNNKAMGIMGVSNEMFKYVKKDAVSTLIANFFEILINEHIMPQSMNIGLLTCLIKDYSGDHMSVDNLRPITLSDTIAIILENYILKATQAIKTDDNQFGFKKNSSCSHAIFIFKEAQRIFRVERKEGYAVFFDFSKAFDRVNRNKMMQLLIGKIDEQLWMVLYNYYKISKIIIQAPNGEKSKPIQSTVGVKQGGPLSPDVFIKIIDKMIGQIKASQNTLNRDGIDIGVTGYADDTMAIAETPSGVKAVTQIVEQFCLKNDILLNGKKSVWMKLGEKPFKHPITKVKLPRPELEAENFYAAGVKMEKIYSFKFLGMHVTSDGDDNFHIEKRKAIASMAAKELDKIGLKNSLLDPEIKGMMAQSLVRTKLSYGLENATMTPTTIQKLETFENNIIKKYFNVSRKSYTAPLLEIAKVRPLSDSIKIRKYNTIVQMLSNNLTGSIILRNNEHIHSDTIKSLGSVANEPNVLKKRNGIIGECLSKIAEINMVHQNKTKSNFTLALEHLLRNNTSENQKLVQFMLHAKNGMREAIGIG
jgi:hypothetical protein